jgi:hypothetical protein
VALGDRREGLAGAHLVAAGLGVAGVDHDHDHGGDGEEGEGEGCPSRRDRHGASMVTRRHPRIHFF